MSSVNSATAAPTNDLLGAMNAKPATVDSVEAESNKFMKLLVTQMRNQDPLNPLDNAQVTSQLAQLSTVTGVNKLNTTLESLKSSYQSSEQLAATNLIGRGVLVEGNLIGLQQSNAVFGVELGSDADKVLVIIKDRNGKEVQTIDLGANEAGSIPLAWDGVPDPTKKDADGKPITVPDGAYSFEVVAMRGTEKLKDVKALQFDSVASVTTNGKDGVKLNLPVKGAVTMADIKQVL